MVPAIVQVVERLRPPDTLSQEQAEVWYNVVENEPADWFSESNLPLLEQYCRHVVASRRVAQLIKDAETDIDPDTKQPTLRLESYDRLLKMQEREGRAMVAIARSMRLSQRSTTTPRGTISKRIGKKPWEA
jgi:hypothetical protein